MKNKYKNTKEQKYIIIFSHHDFKNKKEPFFEMEVSELP